MLEFILNIDEHLREFVVHHGPWVYGLLFLIVFAETGLVVTPFLPGDSLLFAAGAMAGQGVLDFPMLWGVLTIAAVAGDAVNYSIGHFVGPRIFTKEDRTSFWHRVLNRDHLMKAHKFFEKYGGKAVVLGRFVPIVRTFVPFVAGCGTMSYSKFAFYNVMGGIVWVTLCTGAGYKFGKMEVVKDNFELVVVGIVVVSLLPILWGYLISRMNRASAGEQE